MKESFPTHQNINVHHSEYRKETCCHFQGAPPQTCKPVSPPSHTRIASNEHVPKKKSNEQY